MITRTCPPVGDGACPAICQPPATKCTIPALAAGTYTVEVAGETPGRTQRELVVAAGGTRSSCTLPGPSQVPPPLDGALYGKSCSGDPDCVLVAGGNVCGQCDCPNLAIAKSSSAAHGSDYRERTSQCPSSKGIVKCAPCAPAKAACEIAPGGLTGTCVLKPGF